MTTTSSQQIQVVSADVSLMDDVLASLVVAFSADPLMRWMFPDPARYHRHWHALVRIYTAPAFATGTAYYTRGFTGAALWLKPDTHSDDEALEARVRDLLDPDRAEELLEVLGCMAAGQPDEPHWYLALVAVDPMLRGLAIGSALMAPALAEMDQEHLPAYVVSSNPDSEPFYRRHGFEPLDVISVAGSPPLRPMIRHARST